MKYFAVVLCCSCFCLNSLAQSNQSASCNKGHTFCWYGPYSDGTDEVSASGDRWVSPDKKEPALEFITALRCLKSLKVCIMGRNLELLGKRITFVDVFYVSKWGSVQIEATREWQATNDGCTVDSLLLNKVEQSATLVSTPGPTAGTKECVAMQKPKTVTYTLVDIGG